MQNLSPQNHNENDLYELLVTSNTRPEGSYNHSLWEVQTKGEVDSDTVLVTSVHESMHDHLNNCTAYGLVLIVLAHLFRESVIEKRSLAQCVNACRTAHEIFATYTSLLIVSPQGVQRELIEADYPDYLKYVDQAVYLLKGVNKGHLQYALINSFIRVCFQNPALVSYLEQGSLLKIKPIDSPDRRLMMLSRYLNAERLASWLEMFVNTHKTPDAARHFIELDSDIDLSNAKPQHFDAMGQSLSNFVYEAIRQDESVGFAVMESDDHLSFLDDLLRYANELAPMQTATMPLVADKDYDKINALSQYESEVIILNEALLPAVVFPFAEYPTCDWNKLLTRADGTDYLYILSRITERLITQYHFSDEDKAWLLAHHPDFVVMIVVKEQVDGQPVLAFVVLDTPKQLKALDKKQFPMMTNSSMLLTSDNAWETWHEQIDKYSTHTLLFDLSPSVHLQRSFCIYETVQYNSFHLEAGGNEYIFIILIGKAKGMRTNVFFIPCSAVMSNLLLATLQKQGKHYHLLEPEKDLSADMQWMLRVQMTRLLDESRYDFKALSSQYAIRGFENDRFHTAG